MVLFVFQIKALPLPIPLSDSGDPFRPQGYFMSDWFVLVF